MAQRSPARSRSRETPTWVLESWRTWPTRFTFRRSPATQAAAFAPAWRLRRWPGRGRGVVFCDHALMANDNGRSGLLNPVRRQEERVTALELFFDLVFVLAITQCTALMADEPTWEGLAKGLLVLVVLWWAWVGYAWLTSVVDPEDGMVRLVIFAAMGAMLICALCVPEVFEDLGLTFAIAYGVVRAAHIALFSLASRYEPDFRRSVIGFGIGTAIGVGLLVLASQLDGIAQGAIWLLAIILDLGEPFVFGASGWRLVPNHFAERHGLIVIVALGESIVAIGIGAEHGVDGGVIVAASLGVTIVGALWWLYFDMVSTLAAHRLADAPEGRVQNEMARDAYSYMHLPLVAGVVLVALGLKTTLAHVDEPLDAVTCTALLGGVALYLLGAVAFKWRTLGVISTARSLVAGVLVCAIPLGAEVDSTVAVGAAAFVIWGLIAYEAVHNEHDRAEVRREMTTGASPD